MTHPIAEAINLQKTYRGGMFGRQCVSALQDVTLSVEAGEIFGLLGPNGAGKTTLIKVLLGIIRGNGGQARLFSQPAGQRAMRRRVGYLPEGHRLPRHLTAFSALDYYGGLSGLSRGQIKRRGPEMLELVGLAKWGKTRVAKFSKGMLQRLGLAQAMLHDPELLILDEPTDGVDPVGRANMRRLMNRLRESGKTIFLNSHLLQELELVCDRVAILVDGRVAAQGTLEEIRRRAAAGRIELLVRVLGEPANVAATLKPFDVVSTDTLPEGLVQTVVTLGEQREIDAVVDHLRAASLSLVELRRRENSLEEAFLNLVQKRDVDEESR